MSGTGLAADRRDFHRETLEEVAAGLVCSVSGLLRLARGGVKWPS